MRLSWPQVACISGGCGSGAVLTAIRAGIKYLCALVQRRTSAAQRRCESLLPRDGLLAASFLAMHSVWLHCTAATCPETVAFSVSADAVHQAVCAFLGDIVEDKEQLARLCGGCACQRSAARLCVLI